MSMVFERFTSIYALKPEYVASFRGNSNTIIVWEDTGWTLERCVVTHWLGRSRAQLVGRARVVIKNAPR